MQQMRCLEAMARKIRTGDVFSIELPNEKYAFLRKYNGAVIAVYKQKGDSPDDYPKDDLYEFYVCVYKHVFKKWHYVTNLPFISDEDAWGPPFCWVDQISGEYSLYYRGERRPCTYDECKDLEILAVWDENHLIDRIMGNHKWEQAMRKPRD